VKMSLIRALTVAGLLATSVSAHASDSFLAWLLGR